MTTPQPEDPHEVGAEEVPWQRLDPRVVVASLLRMLVRLVPAAAGWWFFNTDNDAARYTVIVLAVLAVLNPANQALNYIKVRFRLTGGELQHTTGLLVRRSNRIPLHRVRTVDITAPLSNRLLGLVILRVGTGGNSFTGEGTLTLNGLRRTDALHLRAELLRRSGPEVATSLDPRVAEPAGEEIQTLRWRWVVFHMVGAWLIAGPMTVIGTLYGVVSLVGREEWVGEQVMGILDRVPWGAWAVTSLGLVVVLGAASGAVVFAEAWWGYRLVREPSGRFLATRGLLTTRSFTADHDRLRGVTLSRPLLTRLLGGARLAPVMTGVSLAQMMTESSSMLPGTTRDVALRVATALLGRPVLDDDGTPAAGPFVAHPRAARRRAVARYLIATALLAAALWAGAATGWWSGWLLLLPAALVPVSVVAGHGYYRALGHRLDDDYLYLRRGFFSHRTDVLQARGINGAHVSQSPVQRMLGLASLTVTTAAGEQGYTGVDLALADAAALAATLTDEVALV
ncbi:PH domain-containing protein [Georgenia wangjunii]|uniref:PH domain-containing protein n=1 Tax=Georgenia wangjunii TaxID=3117730 RepID=UPI002F25F9EE